MLEKTVKYLCIHITHVEVQSTQGMEMALCVRINASNNIGVVYVTSSN